jgi:hypothetical protein
MLYSRLRKVGVDVILNYELSRVAAALYLLSDLFVNTMASAGSCFILRKG